MISAQIMSTSPSEAEPGSPGLNRAPLDVMCQLMSPLVLKCDWPYFQSESNVGWSFM